MVGVCNLTVSQLLTIYGDLFPSTSQNNPKLFFFGHFLAIFGYPKFWDRAETILERVI